MRRLLILSFMLTGLAACETVAGMGRDVEAGGEAIQSSSAEVQADM